MTKGEFNKLTNLSHLLAATTDVIISDIVEVRFLILALDGIALCRGSSQDQMLITTQAYAPV